MESETSSLIIQVNNKSWENVSVTVSARPLFKLLDGNVIFFWFQWLWSFIKTDVRPGQIKVVNTVTSWNLITHALGSQGWRLYYISVFRNCDNSIAEHVTPLKCTWIVDQNGIYQEDEPENRFKFKRDIGPWNQDLELNNVAVSM